MNQANPKLKSRMYAARYPAAGDLVMGKVRALDGNEVVVYLVEYRKNAKLVFSANLPVRELTLRRKEAFRVAEFNTESHEITLNANPLPIAEIWELEMRFNKAKFVHSVMYSVADHLRIPLKDVYQVAGWPSFEGLENVHENEHFRACQNSSLKEKLVEQISLMEYRSLRIKHPWWLQSCTLKQLHDICYAIALTRQAEAFFKKIEDLGIEEFLSIQEVLNIATDLGLVRHDYTIGDLTSLVKQLKRQGFILETECPLTYALKRTHSPSKSVRTFKVPHIEVFTAGNDIPDDWIFDKIIKELDNDQLLTCSVVMFPSYANKSKKLEDILEPTAEEFAEYNKLMEEGNTSDLDLHTMCLSGDGVDRNGKAYYEFQDSLGDVDNGDRGYIRFAVKPNTIAECVFFKVLVNNDE